LALDIFWRAGSRFSDDLAGTALMYSRLLIIMFVIPLLPAVVTYLLLARLTSWRLSMAALASRLWRIVIGIGVVIAFNYVSLWIEQQDWFTSLTRT
jgi:hypothetical protein